MERYIGLDAHASTCTLAVVGPSGKRLGSHVVETNARALIEVLRGIGRNRHVCLEEGTLSEWLHEVPEPHVEELVVAGVRKSRGPKRDKPDAFALAGLKARAEKTLLAEARTQREWRLLKTCPGLGPIRTAELLPVVVTPYRFRSRSGFWAYCGLGIVMRSSSDWVRAPSGEWVKTAVQRTRGLNQNFNHTLKRIFKGATTTVIGRAEDDRIYRHYERLLEEGTKPNLAKLTLARQIAAITLALWRSGCDRLPDCDAELEQRICHLALSKRSGISSDADAGGQEPTRRRVGRVHLDRQPHRRKSTRRVDMRSTMGSSGCPSPPPLPAASGA
ncbi:MAG: IS110 family transposase [Gemmatimonadetes bacterium]|nr:IS110 family transposase [Gemmatimonadota bacterium]